MEPSGLTAVLMLALLGGCAGKSVERGPTRQELGGASHAHTHVARRVVPEGAGAPLFNDLGGFQRNVTTADPLAQRYFSQGLVLTYGFNHAEAQRSFAEASSQDPSCAMCAWGEALVLGPNINKAMDDADLAKAYEASRRAAALAVGASPVEQALIEALQVRYAQAPVEDRTLLDRAYANAMREVAHAWPDDADVQTLFAEALMDTMPWDYYLDGDTPKPETLEVLTALDHAMQLDDDHIGALHLYIHAVEPSNTPERGEASADRLGPLSPGAGHLVHMPSHIYLRTGRYHDASLANEKAAAADESYIAQCRAQDFYPAAYYPHNVHFLYAAAAFEGRSAVSLAAARKLVGNMTPEIVSQVSVAEEFAPMELYALARFGRWDEILAAPKPDADWLYAGGVWYFARGLAHVARGDDSEAREALVVVRNLAAEPSLREFVFASGATPSQLLTLGGHVIEARLESRAGQHDAAVTRLEEAVALQDALPYTEPPPFYFPTREALGQTLFDAGRFDEAEAAFREQLLATPRNGWSLHGLAESLRAQGRDADAAEAATEFEAAWSRADTKLTGAVF